MGDLKVNQQAVASEQVLGLTSRAPAPLHALAGRGPLSSQRFINMVVSNVPGVQLPAWAGGARLLEAYPLLPVAANLAVVICVASYNGGMYFGVVGDYDAFHDLDVLAQGLEGGVQNLERAAGSRPPRPVAKAATKAAGRAIRLSRPSTNGTAGTNGTNGAHRTKLRKAAARKVSRSVVRDAARAAASSVPAAGAASARSGRRPLS